MKTSAKKSLIALSMTQLSNKKKAKLISLAKNPESLLGSKTALKERFFKLNEKAAYYEFCNCCEKVEDELTRLDSMGAKVLSFLDSDYPEQLRDIVEPPLILYLWGNADALKKRCIAVVGTRRATRYGLKVAAEFTRDFARANLAVVSGFARGIDSEAHRICIEEETTTIAVLGNGLNVCYPAENRQLKEKMLKGGGLFVTEYPLDTKPLSYHFPERNRIVSGLAEGVFLPEAAERSGSLITVGHALEQGREIFVVPGNINTPSSMGSNKLIRSMQGAFVLESSDVLSALGIYPKEKKEDEPLQLSFVEQKILDSLYHSQKHFEELIALTDCSVSELSAVLLNLELLGAVAKLSGNFYMLQ